MRQYLDLMDRIQTAASTEARTAPAPARCSVFGHQMRFDLGDGFPLLTTKKLHVKSIVHELLWFLAGDTNISYLKDHGVRIWDEWADERGDLGPVYGHQWRSWPARRRRDDRSDRTCRRQIRRNPNSRRLIVTAWNPAEVEKMALPPCHCLFQFYVAGRAALLPALPALGRRLPRRAVQHRVLCAAHDDGRAGDGAAAGRLRPHVRRRASVPEPPRAGARAACRARRGRCRAMRINPAVKDIFGFRYEDFALEGYDPHPHIKAEVAV